MNYLPPEQLEIRPGSVGKAIPNTEAYIVNEDGQRAGPGEVGELVVRGAHVMPGYWEDPQATARALRPGPNVWERVLHTGDLFRMDEDGYLYFVGRKDDIRKPLKLVIEADTEFQAKLRAIKNAANANAAEASQYEFLLTDALDTLDSSAEDHRKTVTEVEEYVKRKKKTK